MATENMNKKALYISTIAAIILLIGLLLYHKKTKHVMETNKAIVFLVVERQVLDINKEKYALSDIDFIDWYKSKAKIYRFSNELYRDVFVFTPQINSSLDHKIMGFDLLPDSFPSPKRYFWLDRYYAESFIRFMDRQYEQVDSAELNGLTKVLKDVVEDKVSVMVEYSVKDGWFDYQEALRDRKELEEEVKRNLKGVK